MILFLRDGTVETGNLKYINLQWNPGFSNSQFFEPPDFSNHGQFPLHLLQPNTVILPPLFRTRDFSKLPIFGTNLAPHGRNL